uniref:Uncharacterized protein n=1 Tax=Molossus molossus TaxID=27622 RepID=A0A7J8JWX8_MOLMO|nr:hypothetical protein HJG59_007865 [Molossus molossus]
MQVMASAPPSLHRPQRRSQAAQRNPARSAFSEPSWVLRRRSEVLAAPDRGARARPGRARCWGGPRETSGRPGSERLCFWEVPGSLVRFAGWGLWHRGASSKRHWVGVHLSACCARRARCAPPLHTQPDSCWYFCVWT